MTPSRRRFGALFETLTAAGIAGVGIAAAWAPATVAAAEEAVGTLQEVNVSEGRDAGYSPSLTSTAAKVDTPLKDIPQTVNVISRDVIRDQAARGLTQALKTVPGIGLSTADGRDQLVIRGFVSMGDYFLDGVRDDSFYLRDLYNIERIEVIKGPAAVLYGRGSSGGLINRITKKPLLEGPLREVGLSVGSFDLRRAEFDINQPLSDTLAVRLIGAVENSGSFRQQAFLKNADFAPSLLWKDGAQSLLLQYDIQRQKRVVDFGIPGFRGLPANVDVSTFYGAADAARNDLSTTTAEALTAQYKHRLSDQTSISNTLRLTDFELDRANTRVVSVNPTLAVPTVTFNRGNIVREERGLFNQLELVTDWQWGATRQKALLGLEYSDQRRFQSVLNSRNSGAGAITYTTSLFNPALQNLPSTVPQAVANGPQVGDFRQISRSAYAQLQSQWTPTIKTVAGFRADDFEQTTVDRIANRTLARTDRNVSPRIGLIYQPTTELSLYGSITKSFQPSGEFSALAANNAGLEPEETTGTEVGARLDLLDGKAALAVALYNLERTNIRVSDPSDHTRLINLGKQRSKGAEVTLSGEVLTGLQLIAGYGYTDAKVTQSTGTVTAPFTGAVATPLQGKTPPFTSRNTASLFAVQSLGRFGVPDWSVGGGVLYRGASFPNVDNAVQIPAFTTLDWVAFYRPAGSGFSLAFHLKNVTDKRYFIASTNDVNLTPGAPRAFEVTARYTF